MFKRSRNTFFFATSALLLCAGLAQAQTEPASPLSATWITSPAAVALTYNLTNDTASGAVTVTVTAASATTFDVDPTTVPFWLSLGAMSGTTPNVAVTFVANAAAAALGVGGYNANVHFKVSGYSDLIVAVALGVNNGSPTLSVAQGITQAITWIYGSTPQPSSTLTVVSSSQPTPFTVTTANTTTSSAENIPSNWIQASVTQGIAYNFGTPVTVSFLADVLNNAPIGAALTGTVTITYGSAQTIVVTYTITVGEPAATVTSIFPTQVAPSTTTAVSIAVTGTGFTSSSATCVPAVCGNPTVVTIAYTGSNAGANTAVPLTGSGGIGGSVQVVNPTTMLLTIPAKDNQTSQVTILAAGTVTINITNALTNETVQIETLTVSTAPVINSITDAASLVQAEPPLALKLAPYELISIFGENFDTGTAVAATTDSFGRYPSTLSVPATSGSPLTVSFYKQGTIGPSTLIADAYLIYVSSTQINAIVPSGVTASGITALQIVVTYNSVANTVPYPAVPAAANMGVFATGADGQGQGAILNSNGSVNSATNAAALGSVVMIYVSGMGVPTSTATDASSTTAPKAPAACISPGSYFAAVNALSTPPGTPWTSDDGAVLLSTNLGTNKYAPCFPLSGTGSPSVSIGGQPATLTYAGWVVDSVAGLYQINATVPTSKLTAGPVSVQVTLGSGTSAVTSQAGVTMAVQ
jgi:uncharacterized protein (TIGR03437 family)